MQKQPIQPDRLLELLLMLTQRAGEPVAPPVVPVEPLMLPPGTTGGATAGPPAPGVLNPWLGVAGVPVPPPTSSAVVSLTLPPC